MVEKVKELNNGLKFIILVFFIISVAYFIFAAIDLAFSEDKEIITNVDIDNINQYIEEKKENDTSDNKENAENIKIDESKIVKDYSKFYTIQNAMENFVDCLLDGKYSESYSVLSTEMRNKYSKNEYVEKIEKLQKDNFPVDDPDTVFMNSNRLVNAYKISNGEEYIIEYSNFETKLIKFGIRLDTVKKQYTIFYIEF